MARAGWVLLQDAGQWLLGPVSLEGSPLDEIQGADKQAPEDVADRLTQALRDRGYEVFAVNPNATEVEGDPCYPDLKSIPGGVEGVVIGTRPETAVTTMREAAEVGIKHVWMHRGPGTGSSSPEAAAYGRERGIDVIDGGCPCMFGPTADVGHKIMRPVLTLFGSVPRKV